MMYELNRLYNADCMEAMRQIPDKYFELAITDPPYGIGIDGQKLSINKNPKHNRKAHAQKDWDKMIPPAEYFRELERVSVNQIIWGGELLCRTFTARHKRLDSLGQRTTRAYNVRLRTGIQQLSKTHADRRYKPRGIAKRFYLPPNAKADPVVRMVINKLCTGWGQNTGHPRRIGRVSSGGIPNGA